MATRSRNSRAGSSKTKGSSKTNGQRKEWDGDPDYAVAFHRPENEGSQPGYTGQGLISRDTLKAIHEAGGECQIACWVRRARSGVKYISIHIEPPYQANADDDLLDEDVTDGDDDQEQDDDDDVPF